MNSTVITKKPNPNVKVNCQFIVFDQEGEPHCELADNEICDLAKLNKTCPFRGDADQ